MSASDTVGQVRTRDLAIAWVFDCTHTPQHTKTILVNAILNGDVKTLGSCAQMVDVEDHPEAWLELRQVEAFYKKNASFVFEREATIAAAKSFVRSEAQCRRTNKRLVHYCSDHPDRLVMKLPLISSQITRMQRAIAHLLGDFDDFRDQLPQRLRLTSGASSDRSRVRALPFLKVTRKIRVPSTARLLVGDVLRQLGFDESVIPLRYVDTDANRVEFVAKNYKTKRTIACEGTHSVPLQLAFDSFAKERLREHWSVDLRSQARGQDMARLGSIDGNISTVDLERASDTVANSLVHLLFPRRWAEFLASVRASRWLVTDRYALEAMPATGEYAKFSSMGNGTTFCIETIIFAAACIATGSRDFAVYGDDIALSWGCAKHLFPLLRFLGFSPNQDKTFHWDHKGVNLPFRESCGADWYNGRWVTPFYLRKEPASFGDIHLVVNSMVARASPEGHVWRLCRTWIEDEASHLVPFNDDPRSGIHVDPSSAWGLGLIKSATFFDRKARVRVPVWTSFFWGLRNEPQESRINNGLRPYLHWFLRGSVGRLQAGSYLPAPGYGVDGNLITQSLNWLKRRSTASVLPERVTTLVENGPPDGVVPNTTVTRIPYFPPGRPVPVHLYLWTEFLKGVQPGFARTQIQWARAQSDF